TTSSVLQRGNISAHFSTNITLSHNAKMKGKNLPKNPLRLVTVSQISVFITFSAPAHFQGPTNLNLVLTLALSAQTKVIFQPLTTISEKDGADPMSSASW